MGLRKVRPTPPKFWSNLRKVRRLPTGVMQAFIRDPSGNLIELSCEADQPVDPAIFELDIVDSETRFFSKTN